MPNEKLVNEFMDVMANTRRLLFSFHDHSHQTTGLQMHGLMVIGKHPNITIGELAEKFMMSSASIAQFLNRLESAGWVIKTPDTKDKRITRLSVSEAGQEQLKQMQGKFTGKITEMLSGLSDQDLSELIRIHKLILTNLEAKYANN